MTDCLSFVNTESNKNKILIVFRGACDRVSDINHVCKNVIKNIIKPLENMGNDAEEHSTSTSKSNVDVLFFTYDDDLNKLKIYESYFNPKKIYFTQNGQIENFKEALTILENYYKSYDHILFLRFDIIYKMTIRELFCFQSGITLSFKEDSIHFFNERNLYGDVIICISCSYFPKIITALLETKTEDYCFLHSIGSTINKKFPDVPINTMVDGYYQSNTSIPVDDQRLNPIYIQVRHPYHGKDRLQYFDE